MRISLTPCPTAVIGFQSSGSRPLSHEIKLETGSSPRGLREGPQPLYGIAEKLQFLQRCDHDLVYISIDISGKRGLPLQMVASAPKSAQGSRPDLSEDARA